jgi:hypothetical protein
MLFPFTRIILSLTKIPIALCVIYTDRFMRGPFHRDLGRFSYPIAIAAMLWIAFISMVFASRSSQTVNHAPVAVGIILAYALGVLGHKPLTSARRWSRDPSSSSQVCPLYSFFVGWVSADGKWSTCTEEEMCISVT